MSPRPLLILATFTACSGYRPEIVSNEIVADVAPMPDIEARCPVGNYDAKRWGDVSSKGDEGAGPEASRLCVKPGSIDKERACIDRYNEDSLRASLAKSSAGEPVTLERIRITPDQPAFEKASGLAVGDVIETPRGSAVFAPGARPRRAEGDRPHYFFAKFDGGIRLVLATPQTRTTRRYQICRCECRNGTQERVERAIELMLLPKGQALRGTVEVPYQSASLEAREFTEYPPCAPCG